MCDGRTESQRSAQSRQQRLTAAHVVVTPPSLRGLRSFGGFGQQTTVFVVTPPSLRGLRSLLRECKQSRMASRNPSESQRSAQSRDENLNEKNVGRNPSESQRSAQSFWTWDTEGHRVVTPPSLRGLRSRCPRRLRRCIVVVTPPSLRGLRSGEERSAMYGKCRRNPSESQRSAQLTGPVPNL